MSLPEDLHARAAAALAAPAGWPMVNFKEALNTRLGAEAACRTLAELRAGERLRPGSGAPVSLLGVLQDVQIFAPEQTLTLPGAPLPGGKRSPQAQVQARPLFLGHLTDARLFGRSALIEAGGAIFADHVGDERRRLATRAWFDPLVTSQDDAAGHGRLHWLIPEGDALTLPEALGLVGPFSPGWGHAVLEFAPQILLAEALGLPPEVPLLIDAGLAAQHGALFRLLAPQRPMIELHAGTAARVGRLWKAAAPEYWPILRQPQVVMRPEDSSLNPTALAALLRRVPLAPATGEKLFLARSGRARLAEPEAVAGFFAARGFAIIYPEELALPEQMARIAPAAVVAGAAGSQMLLAQLFGRPGQKSLILHNPLLEETPALTALQEALGQRVLVLSGLTEAAGADFSYDRPIRYAGGVLEVALDDLDVA